MSQNSNSSQKDQTLPSYSQEVGEQKSQEPKSQDSGLSQEQGEMSPNQTVLTEAYKSQETSQQKSQAPSQSSQLQSQVNVTSQGAPESPILDEEAQTTQPIETNSQTTSQVEKSTQ